MRNDTTTRGLAFSTLTLALLAGTLVAVEPDADYSKETPTLVEFTLEPSPNGTLLRVVESGFDKIPAHRRDARYRRGCCRWRPPRR